VSCRLPRGCSSPRGRSPTCQTSSGTPPSWRRPKPDQSMQHGAHNVKVSKV
jgi:hypothetical protein